MLTDEQLREKNRKTGKLVGLIIIGMFGFGFSMVPLYQLLCSTFGIGPVLAAPQTRGDSPIPDSRFVNVRFVSQVNAGLAADFGPVDQLATRVQVGKMRTVQWRFRNLSDKPIEFQAIHSVAPESAAPSFHKIECFCFTRQSLKPHEVRTMPVTFRVEPSLPQGIPEVTLAYTLYALQPDVERIKRGQAESLKQIP
jgi:cytochrome c oxidase assembly protein subunit 11